jgi:hypothetical protein
VIGQTKRGRIDVHIFVRTTAPQAHGATSHRALGIALHFVNRRFTFQRGPLCRDRETDERGALLALNNAIAAPIHAKPAVGADDPQLAAAVRLVTWAGLRVGSDDVSNVRLVLMIVIPNLAGLVLAFGVALSRRTQ